MFAAIAAATLFASALAGPVAPRFTGGDITFYEGGQTSCGPVVSTESDLTVAVSFGVFESFPGATANPNLNPICKAQVKATINGITQTLLVQDKCSACADADLDLTGAAFDAFGISRDAGRVAGLTWEFVGAGSEPEPAPAPSPSPSPEPSPSPSPSSTTVSTTEEVPTTTSTPEEVPTSVTPSPTPEVPAPEVPAPAEPTPEEPASSVPPVNNPAASSTKEETAPTSTEEPSEPEESAAAPAPEPSNISGDNTCEQTWDKCNASYTGSAEDVKSYKCATAYRECVDAQLAARSTIQNVKRMHRLVQRSSF